MIYGPDDKPIPRPVTPFERWYRKRALEILQTSSGSRTSGSPAYAALWQPDNHFKNAAGEAALATFTAGMSLIFHHADVVDGLVKQFHKDVLGK